MKGLKADMVGAGPWVVQIPVAEPLQPEEDDEEYDEYDEGEEIGGEEK